jgi:drug/metabolite transporter (DMT)-like permease
MVFGALVGGLMNVMARYAAEDVHPLEVVFFRNLFSLVIMLPGLFLASGAAAFRTQRLGFYALRAAITYASMATWFYGITIVPLATATALNFTAPLFATVLAATVLGEDVRARRWSAIVIGFFGVIVIVRPFGPVDVAMLWILASAAFAAMSSTTVKFLSRTEGAGSIVMWMVLLATPISLVPALLVWTWPGGMALFWMFLLGAFGSAAHLCFARALAAADASAVATFEFIRLPYAALLAWVFFREPTDVWTWIGAAIIFASTLYVAHREAQLAKVEPARVSGGRPATPPLQ